MTIKIKADVFLDTGVYVEGDSEEEIRTLAKQKLIELINSDNFDIQIEQHD